MRKVAITGSTGFLGRALVAELQLRGVLVDQLRGDVRAPSTFKGVDHSYDTIFHFGAPSSQVLFKRNPRHCVDVTLNGFINALRASDLSGATLVYPSTGLLSMGGTNDYSSCKSLQERMAKGRNTVGVRVFATYGPGEGHKRDYASIPYIFARDIIQGVPPVIWGDGGQTRDFVHISDVARGVVAAAEYAEIGGVVDVGSGEGVSVKDLFELLRFAADSDISPVFVESPKGYQMDTLATNTLFGRWQPETTLEAGVSELVTLMR